MADLTQVLIDVDIPDFVPVHFVPMFSFDVVSPVSGEVFTYQQPATIEEAGPDMSDPTFHGESDPLTRLVGWDKDSVFVKNADGSIADLQVVDGAPDWYLPPSDPQDYHDWFTANFTDYI